MPVYMLRGAHRSADGQIGPILLETSITASDTRKAVQLVNARDYTPDDEKINALWLTDESGVLVWSLRAGDPPKNG